MYPKDSIGIDGEGINGESMSLDINGQSYFRDSLQVGYDQYPYLDGRQPLLLVKDSTKQVGILTGSPAGALDVFGHSTFRSKTDLPDEITLTVQAPTNLMTGYTAVRLAELSGTNYTTNHTLT